MMKRETTLLLTKMLVLGIAFILGPQIYAQDDIIEIKNGSFEDVPHKGGSDYSGIRQWFDCGKIDFPNETAPDIHPGEEGGGYWENNIVASEGETYLGMVTRENDSWEFISQRLTRPLKKGTCYSFTMQLCRSPKYISGTRNRPNSKLNFASKPIVLRLWGGSGYCNEGQLLAESLPISHNDWKTYDFQFEAKFDHKYVVVEAFYKTPVLIPYNGHILLDNLSDIKVIECPDQAFAGVAYPVQDEVIAAVVPPHKRRKVKPKKKKPVVKKEKPAEVASVEKPRVTKTEAKPKPRPSTKKKILADLDRKSLKKGQTINIEKLFFEADTSAINKESYPVLEELYSFLNENSDVIVEIGGHTNNTPDHEYCDKLSMDRAKEVANFLVNKGIPLDRVQYKGYGKRNPLVSNRTAMGRKKNQRVEIKILSFDS